MTTRHRIHCSHTVQTKRWSHCVQFNHKIYQSMRWEGYVLINSLYFNTQCVRHEHNTDVSECPTRSTHCRWFDNRPTLYVWSIASQIPAFTAGSRCISINVHATTITTNAATAAATIHITFYKWITSVMGAISLLDMPDWWLWGVCAMRIKKKQQTKGWDGRENTMHGR